MPPAEGTDVDVLTVEGVAVHFGGVAALSDANLSVRAGTVTGLIGPNGAGKTTLFNVISGLQHPDRGSVRLYETDITRMKPHRRARLGLARTFQRLELFGTLSAGENVQVGLESSVKWWQWRQVKRTFPWAKRAGTDADGGPTDGPTGPGSTVVITSDRLLQGVGLGGMAAEQASAMPTGLARMVELARALAMAPKVLLLDEPGSGLDDAESQALGELLTTLAKGGMGVLLVEHDMELVMRICDYIYVLDFGDVIAAGTPEEIRRDPMVQAAYLGTVSEANAAVAAEELDEVRDPVPGTGVGVGVGVEVEIVEVEVVEADGSDGPGGRGAGA
ncbi:MAG: ABC transporter ATP-binding protein [Acidimicrobiales bacterium]